MRLLCIARTGLLACWLALLVACTSTPTPLAEQPRILLAPPQALPADRVRRLTVVDARGQAQRISRVVGDSLFIADDLLQGKLADQLQTGIDLSLQADLSGQTAQLERFDIVLARNATPAGQRAGTGAGGMGVQIGSDGLSGAAVAVVAVGALAMAAYERMVASRDQVDTVTVSIELLLLGRRHVAVATEDAVGAHRDELVRRAIADAVTRLVSGLDARFAPGVSH